MSPLRSSRYLARSPVRSPGAGLDLGGGGAGDMVMSCSVVEGIAKVELLSFRKFCGQFDRECAVEA
jgi:hypothetical protein